MYTHCKKTSQLYDMISSMDMMFFMPDDIQLFSIRHRRRQIDFGVYQAHDKRCWDVIHKINVFSQWYRSNQFASNTQKL